MANILFRREDEGMEEFQILFTDEQWSKYTDAVRKDNIRIVMSYWTCGELDYEGIIPALEERGIVLTDEELLVLKDAKEKRGLPPPAEYPRDLAWVSWFESSRVRESLYPERLWEKGYIDRDSDTTEMERTFRGWLSWPRLVRIFESKIGTRVVPIRFKMKDSIRFGETVGRMRRAMVDNTDILHISPFTSKKGRDFKRVSFCLDIGAWVNKPTFPGTLGLQVIVVDEPVADQDECTVRTYAQSLMDFVKECSS